MINKIKHTELSYFKEFASVVETKEYICFNDPKLPQMNHHNFTYIHENLDRDTLISTIQNEIDLRVSSHEDNVLFISDFKIDEKIFEELINNKKGKISYYSFDYMSVPTQNHSQLNHRADFKVLKADNDAVLADGIAIDIVANVPYMGDFAKDRVERKADIYRDSQKKTNLYVGYHNDDCIGNCELFIDGTIVKLEDFDIIEKYQRKGFGTSFMKEMMSIAHKGGIETLYIVTDSDDTAKDMYTKCGFTKAGTKYEVFIDYNETTE